MSNPLVTVVTATRNRAKLLTRLLESVKSQTYHPVEHIVVDGLSSDDTREVLAKYAKKYNLRWVSEKDRNQVEAINKGLRMAKGEFVTVTHDDDYWLPQGIEMLMKAVQGSPADIVYGDSWAEFLDGRRIRRVYREYSLDDMVNLGYQIPQDGALFMKKWLSEVGYLDENIEYVPEYEFFLRIVRKGGVVIYVPELTSVGGQHEAKKSWVGASQSWDETWQVNRKHGGKLLSTFAALYLKNRYLAGVARFLKIHFPSIFKLARRTFRLPEY